MIIHKKFLIFLSLSITFSFSVNGQIDEQISKLKNVIPPSPDASSLGKYGDLPVSLYRGIPQIEIPIYELKGRSISVPVSLSYHASAIKVGEIASWVGLGWSLQAGGVITRSVNGLPDEIINVGYLDLRQNYPNPYDLSYQDASTPQNTDLPLLVDGKADSEPDIYYFNALGRSFKFYFGINDTIVTQPYSNVQIIPDFINKQFTALMEDGTKLVFGGSLSFNEITHVESTVFLSEANNFISAWYLKSIITPSNETISFTYSSNSIVFDASFTETDYLTTATPAGCVGPRIRTVTERVHTASGKTIATIESDLTRITFTPDSTERQDLPGSYSLSKINVYSKSDERNAFEYRLTYSYSTAQSNGGCATIAKCTGIYAKRLKLNGLLQYQPGTQTKLREWKFEYNPQSLPPRASFSQDHWGHYNGSGNTTMLPPINGFTPPDHASGDREPNASFTQAEMLTKITYPTGGYSNFVYEQNSIPVVGDVYQPGSTGVTWDLYYNPSDQSTTKSITFDLAKGQDVTLYVSGHYSQLYRANRPLTSSMPFVQLLNQSNQTIEGVNSATNSSETRYIWLEAGTYTLKITKTNTSYDQNDTQDSWITASVLYEKLTASNQNLTKLVGGVRIKSIEDYDGTNSTNTIQRHFQYENPLVIHPMYIEKEYLSDLREIKCCPCVGSSWVRSSGTKSALGTLSGGVIGFGKVTTLFGLNGEGGKTVSIFSNNANEEGSPAVLSNFPYPPPLEAEHRRGLLLSKSIYDNSNVIRSEEMSNYHFSQRNVITALKAGRSVYDSWSYTSEDYNTEKLHIVTAFYEIVSEQVVLDSTTQIVYDHLGQNPLKISTKYFYDNPKNLHATRTEAIDSKGNIKKIITKTPLEKSSIVGLIPGSPASIAIDSMINRNMISSAIQTEGFNGTSLTSRETINYLISPGGIISPQDIQVQIANNSPETRVQFTAYDTFGNLLEQSKTKDAKQTYLYDYSNNYPIAEITNANTTSIAYTSFESDGKGNWSFTGSSTPDVTSPTGKKCYNVSASNYPQKTGLTSSTKYIVSYWYKTGASITVSGGTTGNVITKAGQNGWTYKELEIAGASTVTISGSGYIDEVRLYPATAQMTTYTYDPLVGVTTVADTNGSIIYYIYDEAGRLKYVKDMEGNVLKSLQYHYKNQN